MFQEGKKENKSACLIERRKIRMYNARLNAITDELEDYQHLSQYKKRFKLFLNLMNYKKCLSNYLKLCL